MFKKKSLKFTYEKVSRDLRHAETLKARESSRFERLSMIRSINNFDCNEKNNETPKENMRKASEKKPSRLEMLFKWKQEKQMKKEMEKLVKKKPFYTGGNKNVNESKSSQSFKSSFIVQANSSSFNSSKMAKSKLGIPGSTVQSKVPNAKQGIPTSAFQPSRIPNSKQTLSSRTGSNLSRSNSTATLLRKFPASAIDKSSAKPGSSLSRSNSTAAVSRKLANPSTINKAVASKPATITQREPLFNRILNNCTKSASTLKSKDISKPAYKGSSEAKFSFKPQEPVKKVGVSLSKPTSNITAVSKGIPIQNKWPVSSLDKKFGSNPKLNQKTAPQLKDDSSLRKGFCFRTAVSNSNSQRADTVLKTPFHGTPKKQQRKPPKNIEEKLSTKEFSEHSLDNIPDVTFNTDISIIKPARPSFAPANFAFQPPEGLSNFIFDEEEEDCDVYQALEEIKLKFMSRTSTPSKDSGRKSSIKSSEESLGSNNLMASVEKSDICNSNDIHISELMTPVSYKSEIDNERHNKTLNKETCKEVIFDNIASPKIKKTDICVNQQSCDTGMPVSPIKIEAKEADVIENQENKKLTSVLSIESLINEDGNIANKKNQKAASVSPFRTVDKEDHVTANKMNLNEMNDLSSVSPINETNVPASQQLCENVDDEVDKIVSEQANEEIISDLNTDLNKLETSEKNKNDELQSKKKIDCSNITENLKRNSIEVNSSEVQFTYSLKNETSENISQNTVFFDNDDSLLDSIDLDKIQLMNLDDSDEDDFPSPQVLKCAERKSNGAIAKRVSILKHISIMNSIAETVETDESHSVNAAESAKNNKGTRNTPRRSKRLSNLISIDTLSESSLKNSEASPIITPRRSLRLKNVSAAIDNCSISPFKEKNTSNIKTRQSMRLIDLNTPEKAACEKLLGENFENLDPNTFLIDFESPTFCKSKKVSLLYSPEKRKSIRKSIRGDLISFSPT